MDGIAHAELFARLAAPFHSNDLKWRTQGGKRLVYVNARTVANRLDDVLGPAAWEDEFYPGEHSVICKLTVTLPDGTKVSKSDAGGYATTMPDEGDGEKGGFSDAFKRAAAKFLVGRYLYNDGLPPWVAEALGRDPSEWAIPDPDDAPAPRRPSGPMPGPGPRAGSDGASAPAGRGKPGGYDGVPRSGKALFAFVKQKEQEHEVGLLKYLNGWAKLQDFPGRMVDWDAEQVGLAYAEATRKLAAVAQGGPADEVDDIPY